MLMARRLGEIWCSQSLGRSRSKLQGASAGGDPTPEVVEAMMLMSLGTPRGV